MKGWGIIEEKKKMDEMDRLYARKKFFKIIFKDIGEGEYIRLLLTGDNFSKPTFWNDIDNLNNYIESHRYNVNTYFNLDTTDGSGGAAENLKYRYCLGFDFDKKQFDKLDSKDIMFKFSELKIYYHALIDSGNGYHAYMCINKTNDFKKVHEVTKAIGDLLGADPAAMLKTQILRVPITFNCKNSKYKKVNIIKQYPKETIKRYNIEDLYKRFCNKISEERTINFITSQTNFPPCVLNILKGVEEGYRNFSLMRLISFLKLYKYNQAQGWNLIKEWNLRNKPPINEIKLKNHFEYAWKKNYICCGCLTDDVTTQAQIKEFCNKEQCRSSRKTDIYYIEGKTLQMEYKICKKLEKQKKNIFQIKGNHLLIIGVLKNNPEGLNTEEITKKITFQNKSCISDKTLSTVLRELTKNGYLTKIGGNKRKKQKDFYKINEIKCEEMEKFNLSYGLLIGVITKLITPEDFKVYCYMRYRLQKGLSLSEEKLADELGVNQSAISKHINSLIEAKYIELKSVEFSNNIYGNNVYRLNY